MNQPTPSRIQVLLGSDRPTSRAISQSAATAHTATSVQRKSSTEIGGRLPKGKNPGPYCSGDSAGVSSVPAGDSVVAAGVSVAAGLVISVAAGGGAVGVGLVAGVTVSVFCSHAARSAVPARMQMYFFIIGDAYCFNRSIAASAVFGPRAMFLETEMARHED